MKSKPLFKVVPTNDIDRIPAQQLETIMGTEKSKKIYQQMVYKAQSDFLLYGKLPSEKELQINNCKGECGE